MIDRDRRDALAQLLRQLCSGCLTNDQFEDAAGDLLSKPHARTDPAIQAIIKQAWYLYSDLREYQLRGKDALPPSVKREVARWIIFLHSDIEYEWTVSAILLNLQRWVIRLKRRFIHGKAKTIMRRDPSIWPFARRDDYDQSLGSPRFLSGAR